MYGMYLLLPADLYYRIRNPHYTIHMPVQAIDPEKTGHLDLWFRIREGRKKPKGKKLRKDKELGLRIRIIS
jgi:hypothetical protein